MTLSTPGHLDVLRVIVELTDANQKRLGEELGISQPTLRTRLSYLEGKGLILRNTALRPHVFWHPTAEGKKALGEEYAALLELQSQ